MTSRILTLLATVSTLGLTGTAFAADLPGEAAPAAVDYVKVCDAYGAGYFFIPGSDTCLRIKGRVRARAYYESNTLSSGVGTGLARATFRADAYVGFDARTSTDLGTVRTYIELGNRSDRSVSLDQAFIQIGYVTVGRFDDVADGAGLFGINDSTWAPADYTATGLQVLVDGLGEGGFVGAGVWANTDALATATVWTEDSDADLKFEAIAGIDQAKKGWGSANVSGFFTSYSDGAKSELWGVKATALFNVTDTLQLRAWAAYQTQDSRLASLTGSLTDSATDLALAAAWQATDTLTVYTGARYQIVDGTDAIYGNLGVDYKLAKNLNLQGEVDYVTGDDKNGADYDAVTVVTRLVRTW